MMRFFWRWVDKKIEKASFMEKETYHNVTWQNRNRIEAIEALLKMNPVDQPMGYRTEVQGDLGNVIRTVKLYAGNPHLYKEKKN